MFQRGGPGHLCVDARIHNSSALLQRDQEHNTRTMQHYSTALPHPALPASRKAPDVRLLHWRRGTRSDECHPGLRQVEGSVSIAALFCCPLQEAKIRRNFSVRRTPLVAVCYHVVSTPLIQQSEDLKLLGQSQPREGRTWPVACSAPDLAHKVLTRQS